MVAIVRTSWELPSRTMCAPPERESNRLPSEWIAQKASEASKRVVSTRAGKITGDSAELSPIRCVAAERRTQEIWNASQSIESVLGEHWIGYLGLSLMLRVHTSYSPHARCFREDSTDQYGAPCTVHWLAIAGDPG